MSKIIGNTTATPVPRSDWNQTDKKRPDFIRNKPELGAISEKDIIDKSDLTTDIQSSLDEIDTKANVVTLSTEEYAALEKAQATNANTLYMLTDAEEEVQYIAQDTAPDDTNVLWVDTSDDTSDFEQISIDTSLSISGYAADAKAVGDALEEKQPKGSYLTEIPSEYVTETELSAKGYLTGYTETDPTVPAWAKESIKPTYTASEVGADASGTASSLIESHNVASDAHDDIREQIVQVSSEISNLKKIYIGNTAPTDISDGTIWIDTSEE